jgi:hypothetical protein
VLPGSAFFARPSKFNVRTKITKTPPKFQQRRPLKKFRKINSRWAHQQEKKGTDRQQTRINYFITLMAGTAVGGTRVPLSLKQSLSYRMRLATEFFSGEELLQE